MAHTDHDVHPETAPQLNEGSSGLDASPCDLPSAPRAVVLPPPIEFEDIIAPNLVRPLIAFSLRCES